MSVTSSAGHGESVNVCHVQVKLPILYRSISYKLKWIGIVYWLLLIR